MEGLNLAVAGDILTVENGQYMRSSQRIERTRPGKAIEPMHFDQSALLISFVCKSERRERHETVRMQGAGVRYT